MTRILTSTRISCPMVTVFDYVTTPAHWPLWHPASLGVSPIADHSLEVGEEVTEEYLAAGRHGWIVWRVTEKQAPHVWTIVAANPAVRAILTYRLTADAEATRFQRELVYHVSKLGLAILDVLILRRRMARESRMALQRLKHILEASP
jgi:uncharacterized protein YndB with AHSA1/START domain